MAYTLSPERLISPRGYARAADQIQVQNLENNDVFASLQGVTKTYFKGKIRVPVLDQISFEVRRGEILALMGTSGSGKTTLLNLLGGIDRPDAGRIQVAGSNLSALGDAALARWRSRNVGFIFQFYNLLPALSAARNVELPLLLTPMSASERRTQVMEALKLVGIPDRAEHRPEELSGGQQQRVAIARALVTHGNLLLCDEPTGDLDRESAIQVMDLFRVLNEEFGKTIIIATHDSDVADCAHRTMQLTRRESSS